MTWEMAQFIHWYVREKGYPPCDQRTGDTNDDHFIDDMTDALWQAFKGGYKTRDDER